MDINDASFERTFSDLTDGLEREFDAIEVQAGGETLLSLEDVRVKLLESLTDHLLAAGDTTHLSEEEMSVFLTNLSELMTRDLLEIEGMEFGDRIVARGEAIVMVVDSEDSSTDCYSIGKPWIARGSILGITVIPIPDMSYVAQARSIEQEGEERVDVISSFGLALVLEDGYFIDQSDGEEELLKDGCYMAVPLNYPTLDLRKAVTQNQ
jgi:hypothetical protein